MFILLEMITRAASATSHPHVTLTTLHMLTSLTHPTRLNPISATSSLAAALPLMGGLVSISKAVGAVNWGLQPQVLGYQLQLLLAKQVLQLVMAAATAATTASGITCNGATSMADAAGHDSRERDSGCGVKNGWQRQEQQEKQHQEQQLSALLWCAMKLAAGPCEKLATEVESVMESWTDSEHCVGAVGGAGVGVGGAGVGVGGAAVGVGGAGVGVGGAGVGVGGAGVGVGGAGVGTGTGGVVAGALGGLKLEGAAGAAGAKWEADDGSIGRCTLLEVITGGAAAGGVIKGVAGGEDMGQYIFELGEAVQQACIALGQLMTSKDGDSSSGSSCSPEISMDGIPEASSAAKQKEEDVSMVSPLYAMRLCILDGHIVLTGSPWEVGQSGGDVAAVLEVLQRLAGISRRFMTWLGVAFCCSNGACKCLRGCSELAGLVELEEGRAAGGGGLCPRCKRVWYCSRGCQVEDWGVHCLSCRDR